MMGEEIKSPGLAIKTELEKRGWTQADFAEVLGRDLPAVSQIILGKRSITPEMAVSLAAAFGNTPGYWLNLDSAYRVSLVGPADDVERRSRVFTMAPVRDMEKRGWIRKTNSLAELEKELCKFYHTEELGLEPKLYVNARKPLQSSGLDSAQVAWCVRAGKLASIVEAESFRSDRFKTALPDMRLLADYPEKAKHLPKVLAKMGVRLVIVEPLPHSSIDGAAFWLADDAPVIVLSLRYDRIDCLWFTLLHELSHIRHNDVQSVDSEIVGEKALDGKSEIEQRANREASAGLIPNAALDSFILRVKPFYSKAKINQFAIRMGIHPGIVVGQLQHRREIPWGANREMLAKIRDIATSTALTDGWGQTAPVL